MLSTVAKGKSTSGQGRESASRPGVEWQVILNSSMYAKQMFEACRDIATDVAVFIRNGESCLDKWSLHRKKRDLCKQDRKELGAMELELEECFKLKTGGKEEI